MFLGLVQYRTAAASETLYCRNDGHLSTVEQKDMPCRQLKPDDCFRSVPSDVGIRKPGERDKLRLVSRIMDPTQSEKPNSAELAGELP